MTRLSRCLLPSAVALAAALALVPPAFAKPPTKAHGASTATASTESAAVQRLHALFDAAWERDLREDPLSASAFGDARYNDRWPDLSAEARARSAAADAQTLAAVRAIPRERLPEAERLNRDLFEREFARRVEGQRFHPEAYAISAGNGVQTLNELAETVPLNTVADHEAWLKRLETLPGYLAQNEALLREAMHAGRTQPRGLMERVLPQLEMQQADTPEASPFYSAFRKLPPGIAPADAERLRARARELIAGRVIPAYRRFAAFFRNEYLPACRTSVGLWDTPDGDAYYAYLARGHTTTTLTPEQIHQIGLDEVARIHREMRRVMDEVGFQGDEAAFFEKMRSDPQFFYRTPDELFTAYVLTAKRIEPELPKLFGRLYRVPFGVRPIPETSAPNTTTAYYSPLSMDGRDAPATTTSTCTSPRRGRSGRSRC
jgi:uncharacterized protein (DUF885 family)